MTSLKEKVLEYYEKGLKAKEISETLDEPYEVVSRIIKTKQSADHKARNFEKVKIQQENSYIKNRPKNKIIQAAQYQEDKDEISRETKEDRKINPEKYRLKRQKEKAKDPVRYNRKKRENWAKNYAIRTPEKIEEDRQKGALKTRKLRSQAQEGYSNGTPICACVKCDVIGLEFLTIDHIIPRNEMAKDPEMVKIGYNIGRKGEPLCSWVIKHNFPKGFQILCWNCNFAKGKSKDNKCPHETE
jgi:hypothetical protein